MRSGLIVWSNAIIENIGCPSASLPRGRQKIKRSLKFIHLQLSYFCYKFQLLTFLNLHSIACHLPLTIFNSLKFFRHACNLFVDELLAYISPSLVYQLLSSCIILVGIFTKSLIDRLLAVLNGCEIGFCVMLELILEEFVELVRAC